jgi:hypothetical protein
LLIQGSHGFPPSHNHALCSRTPLHGTGIEGIALNIDLFPEQIKKVQPLHVHQGVIEGREIHRCQN